MQKTYFFFLLLTLSSNLPAQEIFLSTLNNLLYRLDLSDCSYQQVGAMPISSTDISFHPNGNLYAITSTGSLYQINTTAGTSTFVHTFAGGPSQLYTALTISANGTFYACGLNGYLWSYSLATNIGSYLGNVGVGAEGDLTFYDGQLYMAAENDAIVRVDTQTPANSVVVINGNVPGRIFGIISYAATCDDLSVYALTNNNASIYEVDLVNNTLSLYCTIALQVSGGASTYEFLGSNPIYLDDLNVAGFECGAASGTIRVSADGGIGDLTYSLDGTNFQSSPIFNNLPIQEYTVYITDEVGCTVTQEVPVLANAPMFEDVGVTNTSCGAANGQIAVAVSGGIPPYQFYINGTLSTTGLTVADLPGGNYQLEIVDAVGCRAQTQANLGSTSPPVVSDLLVNDTRCGETNGSAVLTVTGGTSPLSFRLNGGSSQSIGTFSDLPVGSYTIAVTDQTGCSVMASFAIQPSTVLLLDTVRVQATSCGLANGELTVLASGGQGPLLYGLGDQDFFLDNTFRQLPAGNYAVVVQDAAGCTVTSSQLLPASEPVAFGVPLVQPANCQEADGSIAVAFSGGTPPVQLLRNGQVANANEPLDKLAGGTYQLVLLDVAGCTDTLQVNVPVSNCPVYFSNAFSPNGDGVNDTFFPQSADNSAIQILRFQIFDRWGGLVFQQENGPLRDPRFAWDGRRRGEFLGAGSYVYFLEITFADGAGALLSGAVMLVR